jgi:hypothetical protein
MILAIALALLPVVFVVAMASRDLRPWRRTLSTSARFPRFVTRSRAVRAGGDTMTAFRDDVGAATEAYAAYVNAPRGTLDSDERQLFDQDLVRARAAMERAWLEAKPVREPT